MNCAPLVLGVRPGIRFSCALCFAAVAACGSNGMAPVAGRVPQNHRASDVQCTQSPPAGTCPCNGCPSDYPVGPPDALALPIDICGRCSKSDYQSQLACASDRDCAGAGANGRCSSDRSPAGCGCTYDRCAGDVDCPTGQTCACHGSTYYTLGAGNACVPGNCHVDADCGAGAYCSPTPAQPCDMTGWDYCQSAGYYCHTPKDQCVDDSDCKSGGCVYASSEGFWKCHIYAVEQ